MRVWSLRPPYPKIRCDVDPPGISLPIRWFEKTDCVTFCFGSCDFRCALIVLPSEKELRRMNNRVQRALDGEILWSTLSPHEQEEFLRAQSAIDRLVLSTAGDRIPNMAPAVLSRIEHLVSGHAELHTVVDSGRMRRSTSVRATSLLA